jgi:large subunit ribosomal protein L17
MYRNLVTSLLEHERIRTTDAKAKGVRRIAEKMITLGKRGDLHARRRALRVIRLREVTAKVFDDLAERYRERPGGYTRIVKADVRPGDAAAMSIVELVEAGPPESWKAKAAAEKTPKKKAGKKKTTKKKTTKKDTEEAAEPASEAKKATKKKASKKKTAAKKDDKPASKATPKKKKAASKKKAATKKKD